MADDYQQAGLDPRLRALMDYAVALTRLEGLGPAAIDRLREAGWSDEEIHHAAQIIGYFNYINRIAEGLGCDLEPEMPPR